MSAFEVGTDHIDAMITAGLKLSSAGMPLQWHWHQLPDESDLGQITLRDLARMRYSKGELTLENASRTGAMLVAENRRSVNARYREDELEEFYQYSPIPGHPDIAVVVKAISCFTYQACEHDSWRYSEARSFCDALLWQAITQLPGYEKAPWEISSRDVFTLHNQSR